MENKLEQIYEGWSNWINRDPEVETIALVRADICAACSSNTLSVCTECGCLIAAKTRSLKTDCPRNKWPKIEE